jgi:nucleotide-binding universal stress UspA family protein
MMEMKKLAFPVDLSNVSSKIAAFVIALGEKLDAEIHLIHVAETLEDIAGVYGPAPVWSDFEEEVVKGAERELERFEQNLFKSYSKTKRVVLQGDPIEEIIAYIRAEKIDLVVMGTHGRKGIDRVLFGSVADQVVKNSPVPVMTVNPYLTI